MTLDTQQVATAALKSFYKNPRRGDVDKIAESLTENGQYRAIVVNRGTLTGRPMEVLAGNHTLLAAKQLGWETITAHLIDVGDGAARKIVLADNRLSDLAMNDDSTLLDLLRDDQGDLEGTGYTVEDVDALAALLRDHDWESEDAQQALDDADESSWPTLRITIKPSTYDRWLEVPGEDEVGKLLTLLDKGGY